MKEKSPSVVILMPVYNAEKYVSEAIESILNQTWRDFKFLIINDGSTDNSGEIIQSFKDSRIKYVEQQNLGFTKTLQKYYYSIDCTYLARMDADDISKPERIEKQVRFLNDHVDVDICTCGVKHFGKYDFVEDKALEDENLKTDLLFWNVIGHPETMVRYEAMKTFMIPYEDYYYPVDDFKRWAELAFLTRFGSINEILIHKRTHNSNVSFQKGLQSLRKTNQIIAYQFNQLLDSKDEIDFSFLWWYPFKRLESNELVNYLRYFKMLCNTQKHCNADRLKKRLHYRLLLLCYHSTHLGFASYIAFRREWGDAQISPQLFVKWMIKAIVRKNDATLYSETIESN